jgi:hypothetical protein
MIPTAAAFGSAILELLSTGIAADLSGAIGSGTGILMAVTFTAVHNSLFSSSSLRSIHNCVEFQCDSDILQ